MLQQVRREGNFTNTRRIEKFEKRTCFAETPKCVDVLFSVHFEGRRFGAWREPRKLRSEWNYQSMSTFFIYHLSINHRCCSLTL